MRQSGAQTGLFIIRQRRGEAAKEVCEGVDVELAAEGDVGGGLLRRKSEKTQALAAVFPLYARWILLLESSRGGYGCGRGCSCAS